MQDPCMRASYRGFRSLCLILSYFVPLQESIGNARMLEDGCKLGFEGCPSLIILWFFKGFLHKVFSGPLSEFAENI